MTASGPTLRLSRKTATAVSFSVRINVPPQRTTERGRGNPSAHSGTAVRTDSRGGSALHAEAAAGRWFLSPDDRPRFRRLRVCHPGHSGHGEPPRAANLPIEHADRERSDTRLAGGCGHRRLRRGRVATRPVMDARHPHRDSSRCRGSASRRLVVRRQGDQYA